MPRSKLSKENKCTKRGGEKNAPLKIKKREHGAVNPPAFFSSIDSVVQSFFCNCSSCWCTRSCSSAESFSHCASTFEIGITADADAEDDGAEAPGCAAAVARHRLGTGRRARARTSEKAADMAGDGG